MDGLHQLQERGCRLWVGSGGKAGTEVERDGQTRGESQRSNFLFLLWTFCINAFMPRVALCDRACRLVVWSGLVMLWCASAQVPCTVHHYPTAR